MVEYALLSLRNINIGYELENLFYTAISNQTLLMVLGGFVLLFFIIFRRDSR